MSQILTYFFATAGSFFIGLSIIGLIRMGDLMLRLQVASKASTLGVILCLIAIMIQDPRPETIAKSVLAVFFLFLTAPVAAQAIAIIGHQSGENKFKLNMDQLSEDKQNKTNF